MLKGLLNLVAVVPDLIRSPENVLGILTKGFGSGSLTTELKNSPIDSIIARGSAGSGKVDIQQATVQTQYCILHLV